MLSTTHSLLVKSQVGLSRSVPRVIVLSLASGSSRIGARIKVVPSVDTPAASEASRFTETERSPWSTSSPRGPAAGASVSGSP